MAEQGESSRSREGKQAPDPRGEAAATRPTETPGMHQPSPQFELLAYIGDTPNPVEACYQGEVVRLTVVNHSPIIVASATDVPAADVTVGYTYDWNVPGGTLTGSGAEVRWNTAGVSTDQHTLSVTISHPPQVLPIASPTMSFRIHPLATAPAGTAALQEALSDLTAAVTGATTGLTPVAQQIATGLNNTAAAQGRDLSVSLRRTDGGLTEDVGLWITIRRSADDLSFDKYSRAMDYVLCGIGTPAAGDVGLPNARLKFNQLRQRRFLPFNDTVAYRVLKVATEAFLLAKVGIPLSRVFGFAGTAEDPADPGFPSDLPLPAPGFAEAELREAARRLSGGNVEMTPAQLQTYFASLKGYLDSVSGTGTEFVRTIPYLALVGEKLAEAGIKRSYFAMADEPGFPAGLPQGCHGVLAEKLTSSLFLELIWSYWHEEGMLVQTLNAISRRFQNIHGPSARDPLALMEIDPLRPLNNLLWGYIQDEQHRLSLVRRSYEYDHHYGLSLYGRAVPELRPADSRSRFLEAFHNLLYRTHVFYQQDDDTTVIADAFPLLNALQEVHLLLSQGAHNQFGDLPATARQEMLMQQWLLARPEFREFLPRRPMVANPEPWMDRVDAMKSLQGWTDTPVLHFRNLGVYGEQLLLSARYGNWNLVNDATQARNWARFWRPEVQGYIHAYRAVTGVDLTAEPADSRFASARALQPSLHLRRQLAQQRRGVPAVSRAAPGVNGAAPAAGRLGPATNGRAPSPNGAVPSGQRSPARS